MKPLISILFFITSALQAASLVETAPAQVGMLHTEQHFVGTLYFDRVSRIASQTEGVVLNAPFETTDAVKQGELLAELDHAVLDARIEALEANREESRVALEKARKDLQRYETLLEQQSVSRQSYEEYYYSVNRLEQQLRSVKAQIKSLTIERDRATVRAPFSGLVTEKSVEVGQWLAKGGTVATLVDPDAIVVLFDIPVRYADAIKPQERMEITLGTQRCEAHVEGFIAQGDAASRTVPLKLRIDKAPGRLFGGMEAGLSLQTPIKADALLVPRDAVIKRFGNDVVFVDANGVAKMFPVTVIAIEGNRAAVHAAELKAGMQVIVKGNERIFPDQPIQVK